MNESDSLLGKFKQCCAINELRLRGVKNLKDLISIDIARIPNSVRHRDGNFDLKWDPL